MLTTCYIKECLSYCPETGEFYWKHRPKEHFISVHRWKTFTNKCAGKEAGTVKSTGYISIHIDGRHYPAHRLAWLFVYGHWPEKDIDHINGIRTDNRLKNLRDVTRRENAKNRAMRSDNTSGITGVSFDKNAGKWKAEIWHCGKRKNLGRFANYDDAVSTRKGAEADFGYHENHGRLPPAQ